MPSPKLKPCPFCGGKGGSKPVIERLVMGNVVRCANANCGVRPCTKYYATVENAVAAWNRRAEKGTDHA